jgi:predicted dehydrogenase
MIRVGVIGVGHLGRHHVRWYRSLPGVRLVGVMDIDQDKAHAIAAEHGTRAFFSAESLVDAVDAVSVAVPTTAHAEVALPALGEGRHVLVEKPIASAVADAEEMVRAARARGVVLHVGHVERFNPAVRAVRPHVDAPLFIEAHRLARFAPRATDVDVVLDLMIHDIDLALSLVGSDVARVDAVGVPVLTATGDIANARLVFDNGAVANLTASRVSREGVRKIRLFQRNAYVSIDCLRSQAEMYRRPDASALHHLARDGAALIQDDLIHRTPIVVEPGDALQRELVAFVSAIRGLAAPAVGAADGDAGCAALRVAVEVLAQVRERHAIFVEAGGRGRPVTA